jgi:peroxiredoxin Q/BCP
MPLPLYSKAPDFNLKDEKGQAFSLSEQLQKGPVILFFYPKAFTPGCTKEVCLFRDESDFFSQRRIQLFGVSNDPEAQLSQFAFRYNLPFALLSDPGRVVSAKYKAVYPFGFMSRRVSYYIGSDGLILGAIDNLLNEAEHIEFLKKRILHLESLEKSPLTGGI